MALQFDPVAWTSIRPNPNPDSYPNFSSGPGLKPADRPICRARRPNPSRPAPTPSRLDEEHHLLIATWIEAKRSKNFDKADEIRIELRAIAASRRCRPWWCHSLAPPALAAQGSGAGLLYALQKNATAVQSSDPRGKTRLACGSVRASHLQAMGIDPDGSRSNINTRNPHVRPAQALRLTLPPTPKPWRAPYAPAPACPLYPSPCTPRSRPAPYTLHPAPSTRRATPRSCARAIGAARRAARTPTSPHAARATSAARLSHRATRRWAALAAARWAALAAAAALVVARWVEGGRWGRWAAATSLVDSRWAEDRRVPLTWAAVPLRQAEVSEEG